MTQDEAVVGPLSEQMSRLTRASHAMRVQMSARGHEGIDWAAWSLLFQLVKHGPQRSSALAESACVDPSTISRQVGELVRAGLVDRVPDPDDGRASLLEATARGHAVHTAKHRRRLHAFARVVEDWPADDVATLTSLLARFNDDFSAVRPALLEEIAADAADHEGTPA
jgi:DNA-binding MarR family transcriptional regulator